jgi:ZIP family zinc transporter
MQFEFLLEYDPILLALFATLFTWAVTALGASLVFFFTTIHQRTLNFMLGFAAGVMIAASFWSLLQPAIDMASVENESTAWLPALM